MKQLALLLLTFVVFFLSSENALACSCAFPPMDTEEKFRAIVATALDGEAAVFSGEVVEIDKLTVKLKIEKVWKGDFKDELTMITGTVMAKDGLYKSSTCDYDFELGKKYLVFAEGVKDKLKANKCSRTSILSEADRFISELNRLKQIETDSESSKTVIQPR